MGRKSSISDNKVIMMAEVYIEDENTIRSVAKLFGYSKTSVFNAFRDRLSVIDGNLNNAVRAHCSVNKEKRTLRGGLSTQRKYQKIRELERDKLKRVDEKELLEGCVI